MIEITCFYGFMTAVQYFFPVKQKSWKRKNFRETIQVDIIDAAR